jgi:TolB-like protein/DNA-binding winged helix-turn-helix (wHTH) protein/Flp pilus assembly protein TadD
VAVSTENSQSSVVCFEGFRLCLRSGELWKDGTPIKLPPQPSRVLVLLASQRGQLVTRDEIRQQVWGSETFVDFEQGLNSCIKQVRAVLGDDPEAPRFIETVPRRGYRFIAPVETVASSIPFAEAIALEPTAAGKSARTRAWVIGLILTTLVVAALAGWYRVRSHSARPIGKVMLVVLPLQNLSADPDQSYLSDGLTEELITQLGRLDPARLGVIARTSAMQYRDTKKRADQIGRELGVNYLLEGSVRRAGQRVRISVQLIQTSDQTHLWAESYERDMQDVLALEADLARTVAREIEVKLTPMQSARLANLKPIKPEVYEAYLKGRYYWRRLTQDDVNRGIEYYQQAIQQDPGYAPAYAGLADCYYALSNMRLNPKEAMAKSRTAAEQALLIDSTLAEAHASLAMVKAFYDWHWIAAEKEFRSAIELNPGSADAHGFYGVFLALMGRPDESTAELQQAHRLDPLSLFISTALALPLYLEGKYDEALDQDRRTLELDPNFYMSYSSSGGSYAEQGEYEKAIAEFQKAQQLENSPELLAFLGRAYAMGGHKQEAQKIVEELKSRSKREYVSPYDMAILYAGLGDKEHALQSLETAFHDRAEGMVGLKVDPRLKTLRSDPCFQDLLRRMDLSP